MSGKKDGWDELEAAFVAAACISDVLLSLYGTGASSKTGIVFDKVLDGSPCALAAWNGGRKPAARSAASAGRPLARELMI